MRSLFLGALIALALSIPAQQTLRFPPEGPQDARTEAFATGVVGPANSLQAAREYVEAEDWFTLPPFNYILPPTAAQTFGGVKICLDPGHGGDADQRGYKRGATGFRESVMNLEVAQFLRGWLEASGAEVVMTREDDSNPEGGSLEYRGRLADRTGSDLFVSIHHNAVSRPTANYMSVWYHARPGVPTAALDMARSICLALNDANRTAEQAHVGLYSDWLMYPPDAGEGHPEIIRRDTMATVPSGFGVLRHARVPACLIEASFYTNPAEELRLMDREYLRREAWGIYMGLHNYLWGGIPKIALAEGQPRAVAGPRPTIRLALDDGMHEGWGRNSPPRVYLETISVYIDDERADILYRPTEAELRVTPRADLAPGEHGIRLRIQNAWGNWSWPQEVRFTVE